MSKKTILILLCLVLFSGCNLESISPARSRLPNNEKSAESDFDSPKKKPASPVIKIIVQDEGVYQLTQTEVQNLTNGIGDIQNAELYHRGKPYPMWVKEANRQPGLRFYAPEPDSRYTSSGIYWIYFRNFPVARLSSGILQESASTKTPEFVTTESVYEKNLIYEPGSPEKMPWFWEKIPAGKTLTIDLQPSPHIRGGDRLLIRFWAKTNGQISNNGLYPHSVGLSADNMFLGEFHWNGSGFHEIEVSLDPDVPERKYHTLHIQSLGLSPDANDVLWLDRLTIFSNGILDPAVTPIYFTGSTGDLNMVVGPENSIIAFKQSIPVKIFNDQPPNRLFIHVSLPAAAGEKYLLYAEKDVRRPDSISIIEPQASRLDIDQYPDYLILGLDEYFVAAQRLLDWRSAQGFNVAFVSMDNIANNYGHGYPEPDAIRNFLAEIYLPNKPRRIYVLLLGDFSHSREQVRLAGGVNIVPSELIYTELGGWTVSDTALVDFDQNGIPDIPIGRLPVTNENHASTVIQKIIDYETGAALKPLGFLPVIDDQGSVFSQLAETFSNQIESRDVPEKLALFPIVKNKEALVQSLREHSVSLLVFFGHGSLTQLGEPSIIDTKLGLHSTDPSILVAFTCLAGYFAHPDQISLVETSLFSETGGFVAGLSPTSLTLMENQESLAISLARHISASPDSRIGDLFLSSLDDAWNDTSSIDLLRTFLLLGDPALLISG